MEGHLDHFLRINNFPNSSKKDAISVGRGRLYFYNIILFSLVARCPLKMLLSKLYSTLCYLLFIDAFHNRDTILNVWRTKRVIVIETHSQHWLSDHVSIELIVKKKKILFSKWIKKTSCIYQKQPTTTISAKLHICITSHVTTICNRELYSDYTIIPKTGVNSSNCITVIWHQFTLRMTSHNKLRKVILV